MKMHGQRWLYRLENSEILVDNAFSWWGWAQERLVVNGETIQTAGQWFAFRRSFEEPWLTSLEGGLLGVKMRSQVNGVTCEVTRDGEIIEHEKLFEAQWNGRGSWPDEYAWFEVERFSIFGG